MNIKLPNSTKSHEKELQLYEYIVSVSDEHMSFIGSDYIYQAVNDMYLKSHNKQRDEIVNHSISELLGEDIFKNNVKEKFDRCLQGEIIKYEDWFVFNESNRRYMAVTYYPFKPKEDETVLGVVVISRDITKTELHKENLKRIDDELRESQKSLIQAQKISSLGSWEWDLKTDETRFSAEYYNLFGFPNNEIPTREDCLSRIHPDDLNDVNQAVMNAIQNNAKYSIEYRIKFPNGKHKYVQGKGEVEYDKNSQPIRFYGTVHDITERKENEEILQQHAVVFQSAREAVVITDSDQNVVQVNHAFTKILGYSAQEAIEKTPRLWRSERHDDAFYDNLHHILETEGEWQGEIWNRRKSGEVVPTWQSITKVVDKKGDVKKYISIFTDISEKMLAEERFRHLAHYDVLTDLPNRLLFNERCEYSLARSKRDGSKFALLFLDLDRFKNINDSLGHPTGDKLLQLVAQRLKDQVRDEDTVGRLSGDEFTIILEQVSKPEDAAIVARKLITAIQHPFDVQGHKLHIGTSIGISIYPDDGEDVTTLIKNADAAMYRAKEQGRNRYEFYTAQLTEAANERVALEYQLRHALEKDNLTLHYQPQVSITTGKMIGAEALIRLNRPDQGLIYPDSFISLAEETGLIVPIGEWVLFTACEQFKYWLQQGHELQHISVNISAIQLYHESFIDMVVDTLKLTELEPQCLELEITESLIMKDTEQAIKILKEIRKLGVSIAIDDFGTGHSSLGQLKLLPIDKLKIDRAFIIDVADDPSDVAIIKTILALGKAWASK